MFYQIYNIHLLNGEVIQSSEDYDLPAEKGLVGMFERMKETDIHKYFFILIVIIDNSI